MGIYFDLIQDEHISGNINTLIVAFSNIVLHRHLQHM